MLFIIGFVLGKIMPLLFLDLLFKESFLLTLLFYNTLLVFPQFAKYKTFFLILNIFVKWMMLSYHSLKKTNFLPIWSLEMVQTLTKFY